MMSMICDAGMRLNQRRKTAIEEGITQVYNVYLLYKSFPIFNFIKDYPLRTVCFYYSKIVIHCPICMLFWHVLFV